jgi:transcriptional regulator with XRE-family HTH domain
VTAGQLIRQARLVAGLTQQELGQRVGRAAPHIARWERDAVDPGFETVRMLIRACGLDLSMELTAYDPSPDAELERNLRLTAAERLEQAQETKSPWNPVRLNPSPPTTPARSASRPESLTSKTPHRATHPVAFILECLSPGV